MVLCCVWALHGEAFQAPRSTLCADLPPMFTVKPAQEYLCLLPLEAVGWLLPDSGTPQEQDLLPQLEFVMIPSSC
jgi:hypothetical protein